MEHKHFVTFTQEHFMGFTCFETSIFYHFISKTELSIKRIDVSLFSSGDRTEETIRLAYLNLEKHIANYLKLNTMRKNI